MELQKSQKDSEPSKKRERLLAFDIIRILCVAIIVYAHVWFTLIPEINQLLFPDGYDPFNIYPSGLQGFAVYGIIFVSGAVLEYNYQGLEKLHGYLQFLFRRFIRLYPAFWMSLIFGLIFFPVLWQNNLPSLLFEFTGFFIVLGQGPGNINPMGWFIATIAFLYILFPWFSKIIRKYGLGALVGFCLLSWGLRSFSLTYNLVPIDRFWMWFPLYNAFEFCLGIYIVQTGWYPKKVNNSPIVRELADLSYYVFLFHILILNIFNMYLVKPLGEFDIAIASNIFFIVKTLFYFQFLIATIIVSWVIMKIDTRLVSWVLQLNAIRNFLKAE